MCQNMLTHNQQREATEKLPSVHNQMKEISDDMALTFYV